MGTNLPAERGPALDWINAHLEPWGDNAAAIGLDPTEVTALVTLAGSAETARTEADTARQASKASTLNWYDKADAAMNWARDLILKVKTHAAINNDPQVYVLAQMSPKDPPGETPAPDVPSDIKAELLDQGRVRLTWKGKGPRGTFYIVKRRLTSETNFTVVATVTDKAFTDEALPFGTDRVTYAIDAQQTDKLVFGPEKNVQLGVGNGQQAAAQIGGGAQSDAA
ncbi:MAG: hypothetical protein NCW75_07925 [Phycisphaera sp.]|nr:MAG: hypothetical protein NCW75_07925 [Phycisphaera sp.]